MRPKIFLATLLLFTVNAYTQRLSKEQFHEINRTLPLVKDKAKKAGLLYQQALYYLDKDGAIKADLDSASLLNRQSLSISRELGLKKNIAQGMVLDGQVEFDKGNDDVAAKLKHKALQYALAYDLPKEQADAYSALAEDINFQDTAKTKGYFQKAISLYRKAGEPYEESEAFVNLALFYGINDQFERAIKCARESIRIKKSIKRDDQYKEFAILAENFVRQGNYKAALDYGLKAEKISENYKIEGEWLLAIYNYVGGIYLEMGPQYKAMEYHKKALALAKKMGYRDKINVLAINISNIMLRGGKAAEALAFIERELSYKPGKECNVLYASIYLILYCKNKKYEKAKPYYKDLLKCGNENNILLSDQETMNQAIVLYLIRTGQARKTYPYIEKLKKLAQESNNPLNLAMTEQTFFKADSANGNYLGAIEHLKRHQSLSDSVFNISNTRQLDELQLKYDTDKKDKNIKLLNSQNQLQRIRTQDAEKAKNITLLVILLLVIIIGLLFNRYIIKQRSNRELEANRRELDQKNVFLETLNAEQDKLIKEKEWLIKEVHHRVKNNLQMVTSLLYSQSVYLKDTAAKLAIKDSLRRMQAMALIHQKLYQDESTAAIAMPEYINDLVHYLDESFDAGNQINFKQAVAPIELDVSQAIPLGLIITESIVNTLKYAFINGQKGTVNIDLQFDGSDHLLLKISDNGVGLPSGLDTVKHNSLGLELMKGLAKQLNGTFTIKNDNGVQMTVRFIISDK